ncbi:MAG: EF-hand domain-containing protein [Tabrizicola flagellatus]|uniref:EF-hand domain-containing protein n=1 Tax=Tabrizicola flagellatus TaxID=2593021 RepID=UPI00391D29F7
MKPILAAAALALIAAGPSLAQQGNPGQHFLEQWDADGDGRVTPEEVASKRSDVFAMFDQDSDQILSAAEWALVEEHMAMEMGNGGQGQGMNMAAPGKAVHEAMTPAFNDADGNGEVTMAEFEAASAKLFPMMDADGDGAVTTADFAR